jgi:hypothetical protein
MSLLAGQWELDGLTFGEQTQITVQDWDTGSRTFRTQDRAVPFGGGRVFGRDDVEAATYTWDLLCEGRGSDSPADARALERKLAVVWRGGAYRQQAGEVIELRTNVWGSGAVRILGRPRQYKPIRTNTELGLIPVMAEFAAVDDLLYGDKPIQVTTGLYNVSKTGVTGPVTGPVSESGTAEIRPGTFEASGDVPTQYIEMSITGPATNPSVEIIGVGSLKFQLTLAKTDTITIHVHPSMRKAVRNGSGDVSKTVLGDVNAFALPPGNQEVRFAAENLSGNAELTFAAFPAYVSA